jgi:formylglycine-generating enzyme
MPFRTVALTLISLVGLAVASQATDAPPTKLRLRTPSAPELTTPLAVAQLPPGAPATYKDPYTGMEFVFVKGSCYQMGDTFGDFPTDYKVASHDVCVSDFWIGKYEVTQGEWLKVMGDNPSHNIKCGKDCPVENMTWDDAVAFTSKFRKNSDKSFRLPTEAEWEFACRSGGKREKFCGGDTLDELVWNSDNSVKKTQPVGSRQPNGLEIYDMNDNVSEWCIDWYNQDYYRISPKDNPKGPAQGWNRVIRGSDGRATDLSARAAFRSGAAPDAQLRTTGLRVVFTPQ